MASKLTFAEIKAKSNSNQLRTAPLKNEGAALPIKVGRQSMPEGAGTIGSLFNELALIDPDFPIQVLETVESLAKYNPDVSLAVENIITLGNTPQKVTFDESVSERDVKLMNARLATKGKSWYAHSGGINSLINDLFAQVAINGAVSAEAIPDNSLEGIKKAVMVAPKNIRFTYNNELDEYEANQIASSSVQITNTGGGLSSSIKLNSSTYAYIGLRRFGEKPYAIPPFLSAIWNLSIGKDMMESIAVIIKKVGVMGFLEVLVKGVKPKLNETQNSYYNRTKDYLSKIAPEIEKGLAKGYVVGFEGSHSFKIQNTTTNVTGTKDLVELNDVKTMAGLKQDPFMLGRNFSTTETLGRVILAKMTTQIRNYQQVVSTFLEKLYLLDLQLAGFRVNTVKVVFDTPMIGDKNKEHEAKGKQFDNLKKEYDQGIISQTQFATELGREQPDLEEPRVAKSITTPTDTEDDVEDDPLDPKTTDANTKLKVTLQKLERSEFYSHLREYDYLSSCGCKFDKEALAKGGNKLDNFVRDYFNASQGVYRKAVDTMTGRVGKALLNLGNGATEQMITDLILFTLYKDWGTVYIKPQTKVVKSFVTTIYKSFRNDKSVFNVRNTDKIPKATFSTIDFRAIDYYKKVDSIYLGKFITDKDVKKDVTTFVKEQLLTRNLPIGDNRALLKEFNKEFSNVLNLKDWKIAQIINTSTNKMRNSAAVAYFQQAEVDTFEIRGVNDSKQCAYCANLQGLEFEVSRTVDALDESYSSDPEFIGIVSPFLTSLFKSAEDMENLTGSELQDLGFNILPAHPNCRDAAVPIIK